MEGLQPLVQGDVAALHDGAIVTVKSLRHSFCGAAIDASGLDRIGMIDHAAMRADGPVRPTQVFKEFPAPRRHRGSELRRTMSAMTIAFRWSKYYIMCACDVNDIIP